MGNSYRYGFRVYTLAVGQKNSWRKREDLASLGTPFQDHVHQVLKAHLGQVLRYKPDLRPPDDLTIPVPESDQGHPVALLDTVSKEGCRLSCEMIAGTLGDHDELLGDNVETIGDRAAGRRYRVDLYFPDEGEQGLAVAETCKQYTPVWLFLQWLAYFDKTQAIEASEKLAKLNESGAKFSPDEVAQWKEATIWRKFRISQVSDAKYLHQLISSAKRVDIDLVKAESLSERGRYKGVEQRLQLTDLDAAVRDDVAQEILQWLEGSGTDGAVKRVMKSVGLSKSRLSKDGLDFNNTTVYLRSSQTVSVTPDTVKDLFTYPLADRVRPDGAQWSYKTRPKVVELAGIEQIGLDL